MKEIIKQIEKIKGVKTVELYGKTAMIVTFEAEKYKVMTTNIEQFDFTLMSEKREPTVVFDPAVGCYVGIGRIGDIDDTVISFTQYLKDYNLQSEWGKYLIGEAVKRYPVGTTFAQFEYCAKRTVTRNDHAIDNGCDICCGGTPNEEWNENCPSNPHIYYNGKWATIIPNEVKLVKGEIYFDKEFNLIFRYKFPSRKDTDQDKQWLNDEWNEWCVEIENLIEATDKQKRKLIKAEVKNGYYHELR